MDSNKIEVLDYKPEYKLEKEDAAVMVLALTTLIMMHDIQTMGSVDLEEYGLDSDDDIVVRLENAISSLSAMQMRHLKVL